MKTEHSIKLYNTVLLLIMTLKLIGNFSISLLFYGNWCE